MFERHG